MSPLTKVFVILLVVTSMLTTAGIVVFVVKLQPLQQQLTASSSNLQAAQAQAAAAVAAGQVAQDHYLSEVNAHQQDRQKDAQAYSDLQKSTSDLSVRNAQLEKDKSDLSAAVSSLTNNQTLLQATASKLQEQVTELRNANDAFVKREEENSRRMSELTRDNEAMQARLANTSEKLQGRLEDVQKLEAWTRDHGGDPDNILKTTVATGGPGEPSITGSVKEKGTINGKNIVTIDVGSAEGVIKGMRMYVIDHQNGQFLGMVTIDTVDTHDAIGTVQVDPDKLDQIRPGNDVSTKTRG